MSDETRLTYVVPDDPPRPFQTGDVVEVMDRRGVVIGEQRVTKAADDLVTTDDKRNWTSDGWWLGENGAYPFPWIRLKSSAPAGGADGAGEGETGGAGE